MKSIKSLFLLSALSVVVLVSCSKSSDGDGTSDKCALKNLKLTASIGNAASCSSNGSVVLHASGSTGFTYQLGSSAFQADSTFSQLAAGTYTCTIKDAEGCSKSETFIVGENPFKGPLFTAVSSLIDTKCNQACHTSGSGGAPKGIFASDCGVVSRKSLIVEKSVNSSMGSLTNSEKTKINNWIAAGGTINN